MNKVLPLVFAFIAFRASAQDNRSCQILMSILEYKPAINPYYFDKNAGYPITFYDTSSFFERCSLPDYYGRKVKVTSDMPASTLLDPSNYMLIIKSKTNKIVRLVLNYKSSGAYCEFILKRKKGKLKVTKFNERYL